MDHSEVNEGGARPVSQRTIHDLLDLCHDARRITLLQPALPPRVTPQGIVILDVIRDITSHGDEANIVGIAQRLAVSASNITIAVRTLEELGAVTKSPSPEDRRTVKLELTEPGQRWVHLYYDRWHAYLADRAQGIDADDIAAMRRVLEAFGPLVERLSPEFSDQIPDDLR